MIVEVYWFRFPVHQPGPDQSHAQTHNLQPANSIASKQCIHHVFYKRTTCPCQGGGIIK